ncbi:MAG: SH3 domain-containing protein, partial [Chitinophagales bacterium]
MDYGLCHLSIVPIRAEASDKAEMVNQLLFGETFKVLLKENNWVKIQLDWDKYEGWIDAKQFLPLNANQHKKFKDSSLSYCFELCSTAIGNEHY